MLTLHDVKELFHQKNGIIGDHLVFHTVSIAPNEKMPKGLFIVTDDVRDTFTAIEHGAIAAIWPKGQEIPRWIPNYFPIFTMESSFTEAFFDLFQKTLKKMKQKEWEQMIKMIYFKDQLLNDCYFTYDIAEDKHVKALQACLEARLEGRG
ncbi:hypothetical protein J2S13_001639 [Oikeobacillus pervagus]|uniref:Uncharacterized protein n=1 Tax=Oikeobacillus pervagus TaxID=1325931 RepID=A0AAJ1SYP0_9BACI|nr:hypothetical protein [Oikeobacillus pervagus]MDQ0215239.1 hypothetical protein [Oikeobacillus pervagus]